MSILVFGLLLCTYILVVVLYNRYDRENARYVPAIMKFTVK
jgi:hypothetical protein